MSAEILDAIDAEVDAHRGAARVVPLGLADAIGPRVPFDWQTMGGPR